MILREEKHKLLKVLRDKIDKKKSTIMVGSRPVPNGDDLYIVCLSPNLMKKIPKLPVEYNGIKIIYQELEPFPAYTHKIDNVF